MGALAPDVAAVRTAVRRSLLALPTRSVPSTPVAGGDPSAPVAGARPSVPVARSGPARLVLVACSGGADSLALAAAVAFVAPRLGLRCGLVTVDHGLQAGSARRAAEVAAWAAGAGLAPAEVVPVVVAGLPGGPEAAARQARYAALSAAAERHGAAAVLLGHTLDDQAETVLLALARGAGPRGLAGMPARRDLSRGQAGGVCATGLATGASGPAGLATDSTGPAGPATDSTGAIGPAGPAAVSDPPVALLRPLLDLPRARVRAACLALGLTPWDDPHNSDPAYARSRVRARALPAVVESLGPAVVANLARSARLLAADAELLDSMAGEAAERAGAEGGGLRVAVLAELPAALRGRVLHGWARALGVPGGALSHRHVAALDALVVDWRGQGPTLLPGGRAVARVAGRLVAEPSRRPAEGTGPGRRAAPVDPDAGIDGTGRGPASTVPAGGRADPAARDGAGGPADPRRWGGAG